MATSRNKKGERSREDTWSKDELSKELKRTHLDAQRRKDARGIPSERGVKPLEKKKKERLISGTPNPKVSHSPVLREGSRGTREKGLRGQVKDEGTSHSPRKTDSPSRGRKEVERVRGHVGDVGANRSPKPGRQTDSPSRGRKEVERVRGHVGDVGASHSPKPGKQTDSPSRGRKEVERVRGHVGDVGASHSPKPGKQTDSPSRGRKEVERVRGHVGDVGASHSPKPGKQTDSPSRGRKEVERVRGHVGHVGANRSPKPGKQTDSPSRGRKEVERVRGHVGDVGASHSPKPGKQTDSPSRGRKEVERVRGHVGDVGANHSPKLGKQTDSPSRGRKEVERVRGHVGDVGANRSPKPGRQTDLKDGRGGRDVRQERESGHVRKKNDELENRPSKHKQTEEGKGGSTSEQEKMNESHEPQPGLDSEHENQNEEMKEMIVPMEEVIEELSQEANEQDWNYSDDQFEEEYEEDFDEESESINEPSNSPDPPVELDDIIQAIDSENQDMDKLKPTNSSIHPSAPHVPSFSSHPIISFANTAVAIKKSETSRKIQTRARELSNMIETDVLTLDILELQPLTEYDVYMRSYGDNNTCQTGTQTGEDHNEEETQTEEIKTLDKWTQWPPYFMKSYGCDEEEEEEKAYPVYDSKSLMSFIHRAGKVFETLLEEEETSIEWKGADPSSQYSDPYCQLSFSIGKSGCVRCVDWRHSHPDMLLMGYESDMEQWRGTMEVWMMSRPLAPQYSLGNHSISTSCCLLFPLVFAGNEDGSVVVWDLREPIAMHESCDRSCDTGGLRIPTYTTAALGWQSGHCEPIISLTSNSITTHDEANWQEHTVKGLSFQLLSIDSSGNVCVWVVIEIPEGDPAGSETDHGLVPGGKIKLIPSTSFSIFKPELLSIQISSLCVGGVNTNTLLIGTDMGNVLRHMRYKPRLNPRIYSLESTTNVNQKVTTLSIHPSSQCYFLAGYSTGHMALYHIRSSNPLVQWTATYSPVSILHWHPSWPSVFIGLWGHKEIHIWDLLHSDAGPIHILKFNENIVSLLPMTGVQLTAAMAVSTESGMTSIYEIKSEKFSRSNHNELMENYFLSVT